MLIARCVEESHQLTRIEHVKDTLIEFVAKWRMMIGLPKKDIAEELVLVSDYIYENYNHLTIAELDLAMSMSIHRQLMDCEFYGLFSPMYVASVLDAYLYYRKRTMTEVVRRQQKHAAALLEQSNRPSPEKQAEGMREIVKDLYKAYLEKGEVNDHFSFVYLFLRRVELLPLTKEEIEEAQAYGEKKVIEVAEIRAKEFKRVIGLVGQDEKRHARNWCVQNLFKNVDIDMLLNNIKSEYFS